MTAFAYAGRELDVFARADNWKRYWGSIIRPCVRGEVLEVGAGIGSNTVLLKDQHHKRWVCLEPDADLSSRLRQHLSAYASTADCEVITGTLSDLIPGAVFDVVLYIDVLEHIENDTEELKAAIGRLRPSGVLIVLVPAHQFLYSNFDRSVGHFRRYSRQNLCAIAPLQLRLQRALYLDATGIAASIVNRITLRQAAPSEMQITFWDRRMIPLSRILDPIFNFRVGKSLLAIWRHVSSHSLT